MTSMPISEFTLNDDDFVHHSAKLAPELVKSGMCISNYTFSILHLNIQSLNQKMGQLELLLADINVDFFLYNYI